MKILSMGMLFHCFRALSFLKTVLTGLYLTHSFKSVLFLKILKKIRILQNINIFIIFFLFLAGKLSSSDIIIRNKLREHVISV